MILPSKNAQVRLAQPASPAKKSGMHLQNFLLAQLARFQISVIEDFAN
jgi:hypothetical protein